MDIHCFFKTLEYNKIEYIYKLKQHIFIVKTTFIVYRFSKDFLSVSKLVFIKMNLK